MRKEPAHARRTGWSTRASQPHILLIVVGLLLLALGISVYLLPPSFGGSPGAVAGSGGAETSAESADGSGTWPGTLGSASTGSPTGSASPTTSAPTSAPPPPTGSPAPANSRATGPARVSGQDTATAATGVTAQEDQVTALVNQERARAGCEPLRTDERLRAAARAHSQDMATNDYFEHTSQDGRSFVDRIAATGYPRQQAGGENIAKGYRTATDVMAGWMNSPGHRANILNCGFRAIGVGIARTAGGPIYWTQDFGRS